MKAVATVYSRAIQPGDEPGTIDRVVTVFADDAGEYCVWFFGEHAPNLLGSEMELPYRVDRVMPRFLRRDGFTVGQYVQHLAKWLLMDYDAHNFEVAPEEWVAAV